MDFNLNDITALIDEQFNNDRLTGGADEPTIELFQDDNVMRDSATNPSYVVDMKNIIKSSVNENVKDAVKPVVKRSMKCVDILSQFSDYSNIFK